VVNPSAHKSNFNASKQRGFRTRQSSFSKTFLAVLSTRQPLIKTVARTIRFSKTMQTIPQNDEAAPGRSARWARRMAHGFFFATLGLLPLTASRHSVWPEALLIVAATVSTLSSLSGQVPLQNAFFAAVVITLFGRVTQMIGELAGIPLGPFFYARVPGPNLFNVPGAIPVAWVLSLLSSRGVAQLILRPWRQTRNYGLWQLGLAATLALFFETGFEPFVLGETSPPGSPLIHAAAFWLIALVLLVLSTPLLLKKKPVEPPPSLQPLAIWASLNLLFVLSSVSRPSWLAAASGFTIAVVLLAVRGARF
jgi:Carotenoid biosynthesis protein